MRTLRRGGGTTRSSTRSTTRGTGRRLETSLDTRDGPRRTARRAGHEEQTVVLGQGRVRRLARLALRGRNEKHVESAHCARVKGRRERLQSSPVPPLLLEVMRTRTVTYSTIYRRRTFSICSGERTRRRQCREFQRRPDSARLTLLETTLDDELRRTVNGTVRSELGKQELNDVLRRPVHALADVGDVGKDGPLRALTEQLRGRNRVLLLVRATGEGRVRLVQEGVESSEELYQWERMSAG